MKMFLWLIAGFSLVAVNASALSRESDASDPMVTVRSYIDGFNKGDIEKMAAAFADSGSILDGMAPHVWRAPDAARNWYRDALVEGKHLGVTDYKIVGNQPSHRDVTGDSAYVVLPVSFTYKRGGKLVKQTGAFFTVALTQVKGEWRIANWAWTKGVTQ